MPDVRDLNKEKQLEKPQPEAVGPPLIEKPPERKIEAEAAPAEAAKEEVAPAQLPAAAAPPPPPPPAPPPPPKKDETLVKMEAILAEDLRETYDAMPPELQVKFKMEGERIAQTIWQMIQTAKVQVKKVFQMIADWLKMIPGVNRYFLEQESKIKTDKILALSKERKA